VPWSLTGNIKGPQGPAGTPALPLSSRLAAAVSANVVAYGATGMSVPLVANKTYEIRAFGHYRTAATTTGLGLRLNTAATGGFVLNTIRHTLTIWNANAPTLVSASALTTGILTTAVTAANTDYTWEIRGLIRIGATGGPLLVEYASEVALSAVTIQANAYLIAQEIA
jgi:hypothetical protein